MPLPLPLSPVNSPDGEKVASPGGGVVMSAGAETDGDSPLVMPRRVPGGASSRTRVLDSDSEDAGLGIENEGASSGKPYAVDGDERTPLAEMPLSMGSGSSEDADEEGLPTASPGPEVVDLTVASPGHVEGSADADDEDSPLVVPARQRGGMRRMVIVDSDDDVAASEPPDRPAAPPQLAQSPEVLTIADTSDSDTSPLVAPPRRRGVIVIDSDSDASSPAPAVVTRPGASTVDGGGIDPFALGTPSPGGSVANLPSPAPSPAWVAPRTGVKGGRTPGPAATPGTARKPPATPGGMTGAQFVRQRDALMRTSFGEFNAAVFCGQLPASLADTLVWNAKLKTTAGVTYTSRQAGVHPGDGPQMLARIELSTHVVDSPFKLRQTLCHELCHAAAWLLDGSSKPPHGAAFWKWARKAMDALPGLDVTTCHSYDIVFKFNYACTTAWCAQHYGRHSNSIDTGKQACGVCGGALKLLPRLKADGTPVAKRAPTAFSMFVKERFAGVKAQMPIGSKHAQVMQELSALWRQQRAQEGAAATGAEAEEMDSAMRALDLTADN
jgi:predicted SprT family Zn-dependent metalloprotease